MDYTRKHLQALEARLEVLKQPVSTWDDLLITSKLDPASCREWEGKLEKAHPSLDVLVTFLHNA